MAKEEVSPPRPDGQFKLDETYSHPPFQMPLGPHVSQPAAEGESPSKSPWNHGGKRELYHSYIPPAEDDSKIGGIDPRKQPCAFGRRAPQMIKI